MVRAAPQQGGQGVDQLTLFVPYIGARRAPYEGEWTSCLPAVLFTANLASKSWLDSRRSACGREESPGSIGQSAR